MSIDIEKEKANRFSFLKLLYEKCGADELRECKVEELGVELGFDKETTNRIERYLSAEGLLGHMGLGGPIAITHQGIVEMEQALSNPKAPTSHFPASVNIVQIKGNVVGSQIQQDAHDSTQIQVSQDLHLALSEFLSELDKKLGEVRLDENKLRVLCADVETIRAQLKSSEPKRSIIRETLLSLKTVLTGAGAILLANKVAELLVALK